MNVALGMQPSSAEGLCAKARDLIPSLRERAGRIYDVRRTPDDVMQDLHDAGLMQVLRPRRYGGRELGVDIAFHITREIAKGDASTSWVYNVLTVHDAFIALFSGEAQDEYWSSTRPCCASSFSPQGRISPAAGGFKLSGRWGFCSGVDHAGWIVLGGIAGMLENPPRPDVRFLLVPDRDFSIVDDWYAMGLRGTGSKTVVVNDVFVPEARTVSATAAGGGMSPGAALSDAPFLRESIWVTQNFAISASATGTASSVYDLVTEGLRRKVGNDVLFEIRRAAVQMHLAEADALIECSDTLFNRSLDETFVRIETGVRLSDEERVRHRRNQAYSALLARKAAELLLSVAGGGAIMESHPAQRAMRDIYAMMAHVRGNWDSAALSFGSVALGGRPTEMLL